jgi:hypothetical protein
MTPTLVVAIVTRRPPNFSAQQVGRRMTRRASLLGLDATSQRCHPGLSPGLCKAASHGVKQRMCSQPPSNRGLRSGVGEALRLSGSLSKTKESFPLILLIGARSRGWLGNEDLQSERGRSAATWAYPFRIADERLRVCQGDEYGVY